MTQSDAPNEGREEKTSEQFFKEELDKQWNNRLNAFSADTSSIARIPFVIHPTIWKVMDDYADLKNSELRDQLSKERELIKSIRHKLYSRDTDDAILHEITELLTEAGYLYEQGD